LFLANKIVHLQSTEKLYSSIGNKISSSLDNGITWSHLVSIPLKHIQKGIVLLSLMRRLFRQRVNHIINISDSKLLMIAFGSIFNFDLKSRMLSVEKCESKYLRPLIPCKTRSRDIYFGEYYNNEKRQPVKVFRRNSQTAKWDCCYTFNDIRHIHGVFQDPYDKKLWVTTGDTNNESGIWVTSDNFSSIKQILGGSQQCRAVQLLFTDTHVYFGSDTSLEINYLYRIDKKTGSVQKLQEVGNSVFWGCKINDMLFFSTAVEPSRVNISKYACVWGSKNGDKWKCVTRFRKDIWSKKLFQYGQVLFPEGQDSGNNLWITPFATEYDQKSIRLDIDELSLE
jgi:hypothetical protein